LKLFLLKNIQILSIGSIRSTKVHNWIFNKQLKFYENSFTPNSLQFLLSYFDDIFRDLNVNFFLCVISIQGKWYFGGKKVKNSKHKDLKSWPDKSTWDHFRIASFRNKNVRWIMCDLFNQTFLLISKFSTERLKGLKILAAKLRLNCFAHIDLFKTYCEIIATNWKVHLCTVLKA